MTQTKKRLSAPASKGKRTSATRTRKPHADPPGRPSKGRATSKQPSGRSDTNNLLDAARSPLTTPDEWLELARSSDPAVREAVASSCWAPPEAKQLLVRDPVVAVRRAFARVADEQFGPQLLKDSDEVVQGFGVRYAPPSALPALAKHPSPVIRGWVPEHEAVTLQILRDLVDDPDPDVRAMVAGGRRTSWGLLGKLRSDPVEKVRRIAERELERGARFCDCCGIDHAVVVGADSQLG